jgi:hypothetical protein
MGGIKGWVEEHPYLTGGVILSLIILYFLLSSSSSSSAPAQSQGVGGSGLSSSDYASLQEAQIAAGAQQFAQQNQATEQNNQLSAQLAATQLQVGAQSQANQLAANVQLQNILTSGQVSMGQTAGQVALGENTNATNLALGQAQIGGQVQIAGIQAQQNEYDVGTQAQTMQLEYNDAVKSQSIISQAQTDQAQINANTQQQIANYAAQVQLGAQGVQIAGINAQENLGLAGINAQQNEYSAGVAGTVSEQQNYLNYLQGVQTQGIGLVQSGALNKGGSGGANQVSFLSTLFGGSGAAPTPTNSGFGISIPGIGSIGVTNP